jgi:hypothetical protein
VSVVVSYPPAPWRLRGHGYLSLWRIPAAQVPDLPAAAAGPVRPILVSGHAVVAAACVRYEPGGVAAYRELLTAVAVRLGRRPAVTVADIWVDSPVARVAGRELWGIPKEAAEVTVADPEAGSPRCAATADGALLAESRVSLGRRLPGRWPFRFTVVQAFPVDSGPPVGTLSPTGTVRPTRVRGSARLRRCVTDWDIPSPGPLRYLAGRRPWLSLCLTDVQLTVGD